MIDQYSRKKLAEKKDKVRRRINTKVDPENYEFNLFQPKSRLIITIMMSNNV